MCTNLRITATRLGCLSLLFVVCALSGCEPPPPGPQELGRIVFSEADVPGVEKPYMVPEYLLELKPRDPLNQPPAPGE